MGERDSGFRSDVNGLRAIAVALVLLFHFNVPRFAGGFVGVDVFFVISGYLMTSLAIRSESILDFWWQRAARIVPALLVLVLMVLAFGGLAIDPLTYERISEEAAAATLFYSNFYYYNSSGYFGTSAESRWLLHTWSLSVEWQFYLLYPIVISLIMKMSPRLLRPAIALGATLSLAACIYITSVKPTFAFFMLPARAWEMLIGGIVFLYPLKPMRSPQLCQASGLSMIVLSALAFDSFTLWPSYYALLPAIGTAIILWTGRDIRWWNVVPLQAVGLWSYSVYLWHWPLVAWMRYTDRLASPAAMGGAVIASLFLGWASFRFVEGPAKRALRGLLGVGWGSAAVVATSVTTAFIAVVQTRENSRDPYLEDALAAGGDYFELPSCHEGDMPNGTRLCGLPRAGATLIIGDSHAGQWQARYAAQVNEGTVMFARRDGCPFLPDLDIPGDARHCDQVYDHIIDLALREPFARVVFLSIWSYLDVTKPGHACIVTNSGCNTADSFSDYRSSLYHFRRDIERLRAKGKEVVIVLPFLNPGFDVPTALSKHYFNPVAYESRTFVSLGSQIKKTAQIRSAIATLPASQFVDPLEFQCWRGACPLIVNGRSLFRDSDHLRASVTRKLSFLDPYILPYTLRTPLRSTLLSR